MRFLFVSVSVGNPLPQEGFTGPRSDSVGFLRMNRHHNPQSVGDNPFGAASRRSLPDAAPKGLEERLEILAGIYFGGLLICHCAEFTVAVEPVLAIMIFITKWVLKRTGNLICSISIVVSLLSTSLYH